MKLIKEHAIKIAGSAAGVIKVLFRMLGLHSPDREKELAVMPDRLAYEDFQEANSLLVILKSMKLALADVQNAPGNKRAMYPENLPKAAALLNEYSKKFEALEKTAPDNENDIKMLISELG